MMLHARELQVLSVCPRLAWMQRHRQMVPEAYYRSSLSFSDLWAQAFGLEQAPAGHVGDSLERTLKLLEEHGIVRHARVEYRGLRANIPILEKRPDGYKLTFACRSSLPRESEALFLAINKAICEKAGLHVTEQEILYVDRNWVRRDGLVPAELFQRTDRLYNRKGRPGRTIAQLEPEVDLDDLIDRAQALFAGPLPEPVLCAGCHRLKKCPHFDSCFQTEKRRMDDLLFWKGGRLLEGGSMKEQDAEAAGLVARAQILAAQNGGTWFDPVILADWMKPVRYPISYLDFEWDSFLFPPYANMHPFDVLCFQYSLHVEEEGGQLEHRSFFQSGDCRKVFIEQLLQDLPESGTIFVYNLKGGEALRLKQLQEQFPEYREALQGVLDRMMDLAMPFEKGWFHDLRMRGRLSLKCLLPVFSAEESYHSLSVQNGLEAVHAYRAHEKAAPEEQEKIARDIAGYCAMDTYALFLVYHGLRKGLEACQTS